MIQVNKFIEDGLDLMEKAFSNVLFYVFSINMVSLIFFAFTIIGVALSFSTANIGEPILAMGFFLAWIMIVYMVVFITEASSSVATKTRELSKALMKMSIPEKSYLVIEGKVVCAHQTRAQLQDLLSNFHGFSGNGFFVLNRPFLSSVVSNFLTYFIILMQFRMSEDPTKYLTGTVPLTNVTTL